MTAQERLDLIIKWSDWFYASVESFSSEVSGELGMQLAYLWAAIAKGNQIECDPSSDLINCMKGRAGYRNRVPFDAEIWKYIDIVDEDGCRVKPEEA